MSEEFQALLHFYKVLVDENRLKLLGLLAYQDHSVEELAALLQVKESVVLRHLGALRELGLAETPPTLLVGPISGVSSQKARILYLL